MHTRKNDEGKICWTISFLEFEKNYILNMFPVFCACCVCFFNLCQREIILQVDCKFGWVNRIVNECAFVCMFDVCLGDFLTNNVLFNTQYICTAFYAPTDSLSLRPSVRRTSCWCLLVFWPVISFVKLAEFVLHIVYVLLL